jgi:choline dehydrogenase-like flavoprotein
MINRRIFNDEHAAFRDSVRKWGAAELAPYSEQWRKLYTSEVEGWVVDEPEASNRSDADWERYVRLMATSSYHPVGTCKMGVDDLAVVDPELRVRGVSGLRVIDASIMKSPAAIPMLLR